MKREEFEEIVNTALEAMATDITKSTIRKNSARQHGIGGIRYGRIERAVGSAVHNLAGIHKNARSIAAPSPDFVPPCF